MEKFSGMEFSPADFENGCTSRTTFLQRLPFEEYEHANENSSSGQGG